MAFKKNHNLKYLERAERAKNVVVLEGFTKILIVCERFVIVNVMTKIDLHSVETHLILPCHFGFI